MCNVVFEDEPAKKVIQDAVLSEWETNNLRASPSYYGTSDIRTWQNAIIGTPVFMSPEQWHGSRVD